MLAVLLVSQPAGLLIAVAILPLLGADPLPADKAALAFFGGAAALGGLGAFYTAMAIGTMSVVAPIAALGVVVPVTVGLAQGQDPTALAFAGLVIAIAGVVLLSVEEGDSEEGLEAEPGRDPAAARKAIGLAFVAALGFGGFFTLLDVAAVDKPGWTIVAARAGGVVAVLAAVAAVRPSVRGIPAVAGTLVVVGCFDIAANSLFTVASTMGLLPLVAVGGSMYPAFTIGLAHLVLGEKLRRAQRMGAILAVAGVLMIAGGSA